MKKKNEIIWCQLDKASAADCVLYSHYLCILCQSHLLGNQTQL